MKAKLVGTEEEQGAVAAAFAVDVVADWAHSLLAARVII